MPLYDMICLNCNYRYELKQSIHQDLPTICPNCNQERLEQEFSAPRLSVEVSWVHNENTVGAIADKNRKEMGEEQYQKKLEELKPKRGEKPWWRDEDKPLDTKKLKDTNKYIMTGE